MLIYDLFSFPFASTTCLKMAGEGDFLIVAGKGLWWAMEAKKIHSLEKSVFLTTALLHDRLAAIPEREACVIIRKNALKSSYKVSTYSPTVHGWGA